MKISSREHCCHFQTAKPAPDSHYNRAARGYEFSQDLRNEISFPHVQRAGSTVSKQAEENSNQEIIITISSVPLSRYKPEEISLEVDNEKVTLHGLHQFEREDSLRGNVHKNKKKFKFLRQD